VSENLTEFSVNRTATKVSSMSGVVQASALLDKLSEPWPPRSSFKDAITRVTQAINKVSKARGILSEPIKHSRVEDLWRKQARRIDAEEMDAIRAALVAAKAGDLINQLEDLERTLVVVDPEYFGPAVQVLREATRAHRSPSSHPVGTARPLAQEGEA
jgi:hypothetical protein